MSVFSLLDYDILLLHVVKDGARNGYSLQFEVTVHVFVFSVLEGGQALIFTLGSCLVAEVHCL